MIGPGPPGLIIGGGPLVTGPPGMDMPGPIGGGEPKPTGRGPEGGAAATPPGGPEEAGKAPGGLEPKGG